MGGCPSLQDLFLGAAGDLGAGHLFRLVGVVFLHVTLAQAVVKPASDRHPAIARGGRAPHRFRADHAGPALDKLHVGQLRPRFIGQRASVARDTGQIGRQRKQVPRSSRRDHNGFGLNDQEGFPVDFQRRRSADGAFPPQEIDHHHVVEDLDAEPGGLPDQPLEESAIVAVAGKDGAGNGIAREGEQIISPLNLVEFGAVAFDFQRPLRAQVGEQTDQFGVAEVVTALERVFIMGVPAVLLIDGRGDGAHCDGRDAPGRVVPLGYDEDLGAQIMGLDGSPDSRAARADDEYIRRNRPLFQCFHLHFSGRSRSAPLSLYRRPVCCNGRKREPVDDHFSVDLGIQA